MNTEDSNSLRAALKEAILRINQPQMEDLMKVIKSEIESLRSENIVKLGADKDLTGLGLEIRVKEIFQRMGFWIKSGREGLEDYVVSPPIGAKIQVPLAVEVKSSRKTDIERSDLRQLDDWVFDLSGEGLARKHGLLRKEQQLNLLVLGGLMPEKLTHPSPHKGIMVFNGPIGTPFDSRIAPCIHSNDADFVDKRNLCIIPFYTLISYYEKYQDNHEVATLLWTHIHEVAGILPVCGES